MYMLTKVEFFQDRRVEMGRTVNCKLYFNRSKKLELWGGEREM